MASRPRRARRSQPYDLDKSATWTSAKLRAELENLGIKLTSSVSKNALKQLNDQLSLVKNNTEQRDSSMNNSLNDTDGTGTVQTERALDSRGSSDNGEQPVLVSSPAVSTSTADELSHQRCSRIP